MKLCLVALLLCVLARPHRAEPDFRVNYVKSAKEPLVNPLLIIYGTVQTSPGASTVIQLPISEHGFTASDEHQLVPVASTSSSSFRKRADFGNQTVRMRTMYSDPIAVELWSQFTPSHRTYRAGTHALSYYLNTTLAQNGTLVLPLAATDGSLYAVVQLEPLV